jgi:hypothetical protein
VGQNPWGETDTCEHTHAIARSLSGYSLRSVAAGHPRAGLRRGGEEGNECRAQNALPARAPGAPPCGGGTARCIPTSASRRHALCTREGVATQTPAAQGFEGSRTAALAEVTTHALARGARFMRLPASPHLDQQLFSSVQFTPLYLKWRQRGFEGPALTVSSSGDQARPGQRD